MKLVSADLFEKAILFAAKKHKGQRRKGDGSPYITHPLYVMNLILSVKKDSKNVWLLATATILHDVCEDCGVSLQTIAKEFGYHVAALVQELTLDKAQYKIMGKTEYLCQHMTDMSSYALTIKLCDRYHNVTDLATMDMEFQKKYADETVDILLYVTKNRHKMSQTQISIVEMIKNVIKDIYGRYHNSGQQDGKPDKHDLSLQN